jgi:glycosyltransferase involved in cell wall biosynthesis
MNRERTLVVLPCYNERDNIRPLVEQIAGLGLALDVLVVDDNSPDGTGRIAEELRTTCPQLSVLHRPGKLGLGTAYRAGFRWALERGYGRVVTMDADCSHQPRYLPRIVETARRADLVIGSRYTEGGGAEGWPLQRKIISGAANRLARSVLGVTARDCTSGYRCYSSAALIRIDPETVLSSGYSFLVEMLYRVERAGLTVAETPIIFVDRAAGRSKISRIEVYKTLFTLARLRLPGLPWATLGRAGQHISERGALVAVLAALGGVWALGRLRR